MVEVKRRGQAAEEAACNEVQFLSYHIKNSGSDSAPPLPPGTQYMQLSTVGAQRVIGE